MSLLGELEPVLPESQSLLGNLEPVPLYQPKTAEGALESVQAGLQGSVLGLAWRGRLPDLVSDPSHSAWWERALTGISQVGADLPIMIPAGGLGGAAGGATGTAVAPGVGTAVGGVLGGGAAMFGVPAAMRETLMQAYKSGEIVTAADFWNSIKEVASHTGKEAAIGAATMGVGSIAARTVGKALVPSIGTSIGVGTATKVIGAADVTAQIAAMTGIPAGLQGRLPDMQEVMDAAIVIGGLKGAHLAVDKVMKVYEKTGRTPAQQAADAKESPEVAEEFTKETPQEKEWIQNPLKIQEGLFREVARIDELAKKPVESMTETEKVELSASRDRAAELEIKLVKANEFKASSDKVYDDFYRQLKEVDQTRQDSGTEPFGDEHNQSVARLVSDNAKAIASLAGILPEQVYADRGATIQDASAAYRAKVEAEIPPEAPRFTPPVQLKDAEVDMFGDPIQPRVAVKDLPTEEIPIENLKLSKEVPQFKQGANDEGVVEPLGGKFDRTGVAPIQVWERLDGSQEIISGRHRFDLARRSNEATIPSQVHRESEGFTAKDAAMLDAELNIREGQGSVADYAQHIKAAGYSRETADERGLLARAKGKAGFAIANNGSDTLIANHRSGLLSDEAALSISLAAPNVERLQSLGIQMVQSGKSILMAVNTMKSVSVMAAERAAGGEQGDIFGFDDSAMREAESMAKKAVSIQRGISEQIAAVSGASKRPELAKKLGVNVENPEGIRERIAELRQEQYLWDNWPMHPELVSKLRELHQDVTPFELVPETPAELEARNKEAIEQAKRALLDDKIKDRLAKGKPVTIDQADLFNTQNTLFQDSVQSIDGLPGTPANRTIDADTLRDLRREAAGLEKPKSGTLLYISQDGEAVASGEKGTKIPTRFIEFAEKHGLKFIARRGTGGNVSRKSNTPMPVEYRESGARYFGDEVQEVLPTKPNQFIDRTGKTLFQDGASSAPTQAVDTESANFKRWFENSKVVDADGKPLRVYHGTASDITEFQLTRTGEFGPAIYTTTDSGEAAEYGVGAGSRALSQAPVNVLPVYVNLKNPFVDGVDAFWKRFNRENDGDKEAVQRAIDAGFDGVIENRKDWRDRTFTHYIAFSPTQIKSAISNNGEFSKTDPNILHQSRNWYYSQLSESIAQIPKKAVTGNDVAAWLKSNAGKLQVKADELKWSGVLDYLQMQGKNKVSKEQVQDFLLNNNVQVNDVVLGAQGKASEQMRRALTGENLTELNLTSDDWLKHSEMFEKTAQSWQRAGEDDKAERYFALSEEANRLAEGLDSETGSTEGMPKFASYQLPGGENYKELLITLPEKEARTPNVEVKRVGNWHPDFALDGKWAVTIDGENKGYVKAVDESSAKWQASQMVQSRLENEANFQSSHFEQKNILAHIRMNERVDADGNKVLFLEEIQSDWGQKTRKAQESGIADVLTQAERQELARLESAFDSGGRESLTTEQRARRNELIDRSNTMRPKDISPPSAPFVTDTKAWTSLALKRAIAYAVENGFQKISWTTGEQQAARYKLSNTVGRIEVSGRTDARTGEKSKSAMLLMNDGSHVQLGISPDGIVDNVNGSLPGGKVIGKPLGEVIGKDMADKIMATTGYTNFSGVELDVGGTGMAGYYDAILPQVAKKLGAEVGEVNLGAPATAIMRPHGWIMVDENGNQVTGPKSSKAAVEALHQADAKGAQPGFQITDTMREQVQGKGLPLFQKQAQESANDHLASYNVAEKLITTFQGANKSSVIHELGHHFLETLKHYATLPEATPEIKAQWDIARREFAIGETGDISTASHEQMARTWERYLAEGKAPTPELQGIFSKFKTWMLEIYSDIRNLGIEITPEIRGFFDRLLATEEEIQYANQNNIPKAYAREAMANDAQKIVPDEQKPGFKDEQLAIEPFAEELQKGPGSGLTNDSRINAQFINGTTDLKLAIQRVSEIDQANIQKHRGGTNGVKSWEEANSEADKFIEDTLGGKLVDSEPSSIPHDIRQRAAFKVMMSVAKYSLQLRDTILKKGENATVQDQFDYLNSILRMRMTHAEYLGLRAASARAMNQIRDMSPDSGVVDKMVEMTSERNLYQSAKTDAQVASELRLKLNEIMTQHFGGKSALDIAKLQEDIKSLKGQLVFSKAVTDATKWEMVVEGWKSGLLSGPVTHITNLFGTGAFQALRIPVDALASVIGMARGASVGMGESDRASMSESVARVSGMLGGIQDALRVGWSEFKADDPTGKTETFRTAIPGKVGEIVRTPLRAMAAEDAILNTMYSRGELHTLAIRQAFNDGMNPSTKEFADRVQSLIDNPTPEMQAEVDSTATRMTFNMPSGEKTAALQGFIKKWNLQLIIPFVRTPINIFEEAARLSPFAPIVKDWRADISKGGATRDKALAEIVLGSTIMGLTAAYAMSGSISGAGSPDQGKNRAKAGVWQPYSVLIGDTWYEYSRIQPVGTLVGLAADMAGVWEHMTDEEMDKIPKMLSIAFANAVTNQTFLQGITNVVNAMSDPKRFAPKFMQQLAASFVPNIVGQPTAMSDPVVREVNSMLEAVQARIPGLRQDLLPKRDWLGEEVQTKERLGIVSPVREQDVSNDPVRLEAARLDISISASPKKIHLGKGTGKVGDVELTPEERDKFEQVSGEMTHKILTNVIGQAGWENIPDPIKRNIFHKIITSGNKYAAAITLPPEKRAALIGQINEKIIDSLSMEPAQ